MENEPGLHLGTLAADLQRRGLTPEEALRQALGVRPALGRVLDVSDDKPSAAAAAVVSWRYWKSRFNGDQRILGSAIDIVDTRAGTRFAATAIEGLSGGGAPPVATAGVAMLVVAVLATLVPARRATRIDPVIALRSA